MKKLSKSYFDWVMGLKVRLVCLEEWLRVIEMEIVGIDNFKKFSCED